jgi:hypothetical protein
LHHTPRTDPGSPAEPAEDPYSERNAVSGSTRADRDHRAADDEAQHPAGGGALNLVEEVGSSGRHPGVLGKAGRPLRASPGAGRSGFPSLLR